MKSIFNKFKKLEKKYKIFFFIVSILFLGSIIFLLESLVILKNIETLLRIVIITISLIGYLVFLFISILFLFSKKYKLYILNSILIIVISFALITLSFYINKTYNIFGRMANKEIYYSSSLVVLKDTEFKNDSSFKVGMISDENDIEGNIIANQLIDKKKLDLISINYYESYLEMIRDLYNKKIDGILISSNYIDLYSVYEKFINISSDTKVIYSYKNKYKNKTNDSSVKKLTEPFTLLLMGVDSEVNGLKSNQIFNGDTLMLITFNPNTLNTTIFSIPRDTYVPISCNGNRSSKINSSAVGGTSCVTKTIENLIGINIDYYIKINFKGVVDLVNVLDGIDIDVPIDFCEQDSNRDDTTPICLKKGKQTINGEEALALSRHRHTLPMGDFQRVQHQQLVVEAIANKIKSVRNINKVYDLLDAISNNIETNIETSEMLNLYNVGKKIMLRNNSIINIEKAFLTGYDLTMYIPGLGNVYTFQYYEESLKEIIKAMKYNLDLEKPEMIKTFNFSANYVYEAPVVGKQYYSVKRNEALPDFRGSNINYLKDWAQSRNIDVNINYITEGMSGYDSDKNNIIISQNVQYGTLVSSINKISVDVVKVDEKIIVEEVDTNTTQENIEETIDNVEEKTNEEKDETEIINDILNLEEEKTD